MPEDEPLTCLGQFYFAAGHAGKQGVEWPRAQYIRGCLWRKYRRFVFLSSINISMYIDFAEIEILIKICKIYWFGLNYSQGAQYPAPSLSSKLFVAIWKLCVCLYYYILFPLLWDNYCSVFFVKNFLVIYHFITHMNIPHTNIYVYIYYICIPHICLCVYMYI